MALLCLNFKTMAQGNKAVDVTAKGIQIGQKVPDVNITGLHNYKDKNGKSATNAKLSDFKGKLLILDFWATWCSPCIAMIPKMDSLQKQFGDKIQFLSVTYQTEKEVLPFLEKFEKQRGRHYDLPVVTADRELHQLFPHVYLPHYVWIDHNSLVKSITGFEEVTAENIHKSIASPVVLVQKRDMEIVYDNKKPFLINGNGGDGSNLLYHSLLTGYTEGLGQSFSVSAINDPTGRKLTCKNLNISKLIALAYGGDEYYFGANRTTINSKNTHLFRSGLSLTGTALQNWMADGHAFCYEVIVPPSSGKAVFEIMKRDIGLIFPMFNAEVQRKKTKCLVLVRTSKNDRVKSAGGKLVNQFSPMGCRVENTTLALWLSRMERLYLSKAYPLVDATGYSGRVDLVLNANLSNVMEINRELSKYDLQLVERDEETEMLIIADAVGDVNKVKDDKKRK